MMPINLIHCLPECFGYFVATGQQSALNPFSVFFWKMAKNHYVEHKNARFFCSKIELFFTLCIHSFTHAISVLFVCPNEVIELVPFVVLISFSLVKKECMFGSKFNRHCNAHNIIHSNQIQMHWIDNSCTAVMIGFAQRRFNDWAIWMKCNDLYATLFYPYRSDSGCARALSHQKTLYGLWERFPNWKVCYHQNATRGSMLFSFTECMAI